MLGSLKTTCMGIAKNCAIFPSSVLGQHETGRRWWQSAAKHDILLTTPGFHSDIIVATPWHLANLYFVNAVNVIVSSSPLCTNTETANIKTALRKTVWNISLTLCWIFENQLKLLRSRSCLFIETVFAPPSVFWERTKAISIMQFSLSCSDY